jgi:hypothetical protein
MTQSCHVIRIQMHVLHDPVDIYYIWLRLMTCRALHVEPSSALDTQPSRALISTLPAIPDIQLSAHYPV